MSGSKEAINQQTKKSKNGFLSKRLPILFILVISSIYLRYNGLYTGLPYVLIPDESDLVTKILNPFVDVINFSSPHLPSFLVYLNSVLVRIATGSFSLDGLLNHLMENPASIYVPLRLINVLFGVGTVVLVYFIGNIFGYLVGILASGFLCVSFLHVKFSHVFAPFSSMVFFSLLSLFFILRFFLNKNKNLLIISLVAALFSSSIHYFGLISIIPILFVLFLRKELHKYFPRIILFIVLFSLLNIYFLIDLIFLVKYFIGTYISSFHNYRFSSYFLYLFNFLIYGLGPVVWVGALGLLKYHKDYNLKILQILLSLPLIYLGLLGLFHLTNPGYALLLTPYFCLASGLVFSSLYEEYKMQGNKLFVYIVLILFAFWIPLKYTFKYNKIINLQDTRVVATEWIKENTSEYVKIASDDHSIQLAWHDGYNKNKLKNLISEPQLLKLNKKFTVDSDFLKRKDWYKILRKKVDYVVINSFDFKNVMREPDNSAMKKYYLKISKLKPVVTFNPYYKEFDNQMELSSCEDLSLPFVTLWDRERPGPLIKIYKL